MKRSVISFILVLICSYASAQINMQEMVNIKGRWHKKGEAFAYSGDFIETNKKGMVVGTGTFLNGVINGLRIAYFDDGNKEIERYYKDGVMHGLSKEYYQSGALKQEATVVNGRNEGKAILYYETGGKHVEWTFENGVQQGDYFEYAKDGSILKHYWYVDDLAADYSDNFMRLVNEGTALSRKFENTAAIEKYDQAIKIKQTDAYVYFFRGTVKSNNFDHEGAIADYNKAIELNPKYMEAYVNRASAKINRYTTKGVLFPTREQLDGACEDLDKALKLGADKYLIDDMKCMRCDKAAKKKERVR